jgi:uncharacterized protein
MRTAPMSNFRLPFTMHFHGLQFDKQRLAEICEKHSVVLLRVFGSYARGQATAESDLDILVEYQPEASKNIGLLEFAGLQIELEAFFNRRVDLKEIGNFRPESQSRVLRESIVAYAA